ncbi:ATP-binding cassette domain-containing protein [Candidatus Pelagibacter sp. Uisw_099_02]|uniref:ATP-binding cassette domain-containing protein n=1 Tax=Candidatus Pelagibacter sp. Uisw_099_02 TaxID=3230981 RepID=UPI0039ED6AD6|tara:strand:- start:450 stop:1226 length:777 start_codon:yes stop_codon:yes gene_type:complete
MAIIKSFRIKSFKQKKPLIELKNISLSYGNRQILDNISFSINQGEILGMLGPNGVGKSTIFNLITGLIKPDYGKILINGHDVTSYPIYLRTKKFKIGYVPQHGGFFQDLTLIDNLKAIAEILINDEKEREYKINNLVSRFEFESTLNVKAKFLSGGQKKKLVIALALLSDPKLLLLDECFAALDVLTIKMLQKLIIDLQMNNNISVCICDHQARDLLSCVDLAMVISNCKIISKGSPQEIIQDQRAITAYFGTSFKIN